MNVKICSKCGKEKPLNDFQIMKKGANKISSQCKLCIKEDYNFLKDKPYSERVKIIKERKTIREQKALEKREQKVLEKALNKKRKILDKEQKALNKEQKALNKKEKALKNKNNRNTLDYDIWHNKVLIRDNYFCQVCGSKKELEAHHLESFSSTPQLRTILSNGITLCQKCHKNLHHQFGYIVNEQNFITFFNDNNISDKNKKYHVDYLKKKQIKKHNFNELKVNDIIEYVHPKNGSNHCQRIYKIDGNIIIMKNVNKNIIKITLNDVRKLRKDLM